MPQFTPCVPNRRNSSPETEDLQSGGSEDNGAAAAHAQSAAAAAAVAAASQVGGGSQLAFRVVEVTAAFSTTC